jgi:hypothetical protein
MMPLVDVLYILKRAAYCTHKRRSDAVQRLAKQRELAVELWCATGCGWPVSAKHMYYNMWTDKDEQRGTARMVSVPLR